MLTQLAPPKSKFLSPPVPECATGANQCWNIEMAVRFVVEVAKEWGEGIGGVHGLMASRLSQTVISPRFRRDFAYSYQFLIR